MIGKSELKKDRTLIVAYPGAWGSPLYPSQLHTAYADAILINQFEPLFTCGKRGCFIPAAAKSYHINDDFTEFMFKIDNKRRFSDGTFLKAIHCKNAWERTLSQHQKDPLKKNLVELLHKLKGAEDHAATGKISGIIAFDDETIMLKFRQPIRTAISHLACSNYSVFIEKDGRHIGTGPYVIEEIDERNLILKKNPYYCDKVGFHRIHVTVKGYDEAVTAIDQGDIDVFALNIFDLGYKIGSEQISHIPAYEYANLELYLNSLSGRLFSDRRMRLALRYILFSEILDQDKKSFHEKKNLFVDPQILLPFHPGRLEKSQVTEYLNEGYRYVDELVENSRKNPIYYVGGLPEDFNPYLAIMQRAGLVFDERSGTMSFKERLNQFYKIHEADIIFGGNSMEGSDPDNVYKKLGKSGAFSSPMIYNRDVSEALEVGRKILNTEDMHKHYTKVSMVYLKECPTIHIGFLYFQSIYRRDRVQLNQLKNSMHNNCFTIYEPIGTGKIP